jgi:hydroxyethylthiazole kinase-like uncharacterized protein yjeF
LSETDREVFCLISVSEMREVEKRAVEIGIDESVMMENAGANAASILDSEIDLKWKTVLIFCGTGNNAGDGLVFARHAVMRGASAKVHMVCGTGSLKPLAGRNLGILRGMKRAGGDIEFVKKPPAVKAAILVDAMLGTGMRGTVRDEYAKAVRAFNSMGGTKVSLDCPSGIDADTGKAMGIAVKPDITITFYDVKKGLSRENSGKILTAGIGVPKLL